jgi:hypothetical protein
MFTLLLLLLLLAIIVIVLELSLLTTGFLVLKMTNRISRSENVNSIGLIGLLTAVSVRVTLL